MFIFPTENLRAKNKRAGRAYRGLCKNDVSSFCSYEDYEKAVSALYYAGKPSCAKCSGSVKRYGAQFSTAEQMAYSLKSSIPAGDLNLQIPGRQMGEKADSVAE